MEHDDLVAANLVHSLGQDLGPLYVGIADKDLLIAGDEKNPVQLDLGPRLDCQALNLDNLPGGNPVLFSSGFTLLCASEGGWCQLNIRFHVLRAGYEDESASSASLCTSVIF